MIVFPIIAAIVSFCCMTLIASDAVRRPRADRTVWAIAFGIFAIAAGVEVLGSAAGWTPTLARIYYLGGAVLVVGYLALGELYLLAGKRIQRFAPGATLLVTALASTLVLNAPIDKAKLADDGWEAIHRGPGLVAIAVSINAAGTILLIGGALYSVWRFRKQRSQRSRMIGCALIALGTLIVASGGTLTRFGHREYLYIAMAIGVVVIFAGVLETRRPERARSLNLLSVFRHPIQFGPRRGRSHSPRLVPLPAGAQGDGRSGNVLQAIDYIESRLFSLDNDALDRTCRTWSVERQTIEYLDRQSARRVWSLRAWLSPEAQNRFDELPAGAMQQLSELFFDVFLQPETFERIG